MTVAARRDERGIRPVADRFRRALRRRQVVDRPDPLGAADELGDVTARPGQRLGDLHPAGDAPAFALIGYTVIPAR